MDFKIYDYPTVCLCVRLAGFQYVQGQKASHSGDLNKVLLVYQQFLLVLRLLATFQLFCRLCETSEASQLLKCHQVEQSLLKVQDFHSKDQSKLLIAGHVFR